MAEYKFGVTGKNRKALVQEIGKYLGTQGIYLGVPTYAYEIGNYKVTREGSLTGEADAGLLAYLNAHGFTAGQEDIAEGAEAELAGVDAETLTEPDGAFTVTLTELAEAADGTGTGTATEPDEDDTRIDICEAPDENSTEPEMLAAPDENGAEPKMLAAPDESVESEIITGPYEEAEPELIIGPTEYAEPDIMRNPAVDFEPEITAGSTGDTMPEAIAEFFEPAENPALSDDKNRLTVEYPLYGVTDEILNNLRKMIAAKESLIKKALGTDELPLFLTPNSIKFPWFSFDPGDEDTAYAYSLFISRLVETAKQKKRITATAPDNFDNMRFSMRVWLTSLGMVGDDYAYARKLLIRNLSGDSGWRYGKPENTEAGPRTRKAKSPNIPAITHDILEQITNIRENGANMYDIREVRELAQSHAFLELGSLIEFDSRSYLTYILASER